MLTTLRIFQRGMLPVTDDLQSFYVTLDLSSASNNSRPKKRRRTTAPQPTPATPTTAGNDSIGIVNTTADPAQPAATPQDEIERSQLAENGFKETGPPLEPEDRIQILDLHSANPIVSYQNQIYSCEWTSTIGTDLLLTTPDPDFPHPVLREAPGISVLAATGIKLLARPVQLDSRRNVSIQAEPQNQTPAPESPTQAEESPQSTAIKIPPNLAPSRARLDQASFLERLIAAKAARGETDQVTVFAQRIPQGSGWRSQQKAAAECRASEARQDEDGEDGTPTTSLRRTSQIGRPRSSNLRKRTARTAKGGLFRDYRPQLWDTEGADIRNDSTRTPESWDQLERGEASRRSSTAGATARSSATGASHLQQTAESNALDTTLDVQLPQMAQESPQLGDGNDSGNGSGKGDGSVEVAADVEMEDAH